MQKLYFKILFCVSLLTSICNAQTQEQISNEIDRRGINTLAEVRSALASKGMTESDARKMAKVYGIDYDEYIKRHVLKQEENSDINFEENNSKVIETVTSIEYNGDLAKDSDLITPINKINDRFFVNEIFENNPFANKEYLIGNIDENYILGPGDEIRIYVWGSHAYQAEVKIDLNGNIALPENGIFFASGYTFKTLKKKLKKFLGKSYSGLTSSPQTSFIDVSLTQLRPVSITVLGETNTPGPHLVNGFATVLNALYASGGIKTSGSHREINVYRNNELIKTIDLYDYITKGALNNDIRLMNNDIIFIPSRKNKITLNGSVRNSAVFELLESEDLASLIDLAGGFEPDDSIKNININRVKPFNQRQDNDPYNRFMTSVDYRKVIKNNEFYRLFDGDIISVNPILGKIMNQVTISGPVKRPGTYPLSIYPDIYSLIVNASDSLMPRVYMNEIHIYRTNEDGSRIFYSLNLDNVLNKRENLLLQNEDRVELFSLNHTEGDDRTVYISGFGVEDGELDWRENLTVFDLIFKRVSIEEKEFNANVLDSRVDLQRFNTETGQYFKKTFNLADILNNKKNETLIPRDKITLYSKEVNKVINEEVSVFGYVKKPGKYKLTENMTAEDLILLAGGFEEYALQQEAIISRPKFDVVKGQISEDIKINIDVDAMLGVSDEKIKNNLVLQHRDVLFVKQIAGVSSMKSIKVSGEVVHPGVVSMTNKRQSIKELIEKAGGLTPFASLKSSYIMREGNLFIIDLDKSLRKNSSFLNDGDHIIVGENTGVVSLFGAVENEGLFVWEKNKRTKNYIRKAGKYSEKIDRVIVQYPNGITKNMRWLSNPRIMPNSKIFVYAKDEKEKPERDGSGMDKFIQVLSVITGSLTTIVLTRAL